MRTKHVGFNLLVCNLLKKFQTMPLRYNKIPHVTRFYQANDILHMSIATQQILEGHLWCDTWLFVVNTTTTRNDKNCIAMVVSLPIEVLSMIFDHLNLHEICRVEIVCQKWLAVSRSSPHIWRDASRIAGNNAHNPVSLKRKLDNVLSQSSKKLDSLAIRIRGSIEADADASRHILRFLATTGVKYLWIVCGTRW